MDLERARACDLLLCHHIGHTAKAESASTTMELHDATSSQLSAAGESKWTSSGTQWNTPVKQPLTVEAHFEKETTPQRRELAFAIQKRAEAVRFSLEPAAAFDVLF